VEHSEVTGQFPPDKVDKVARAQWSQNKTFIKWGAERSKEVHAAVRRWTV
jgi:hypothetical protein